MKRIYFDTSAYVKIYSQEAGTEVADSLFKLAEDRRTKIVMSIWAVNETIAAIDRKNRRKEIRDPQRDMIFATIIKRTAEYAENPNAPIDFIPITRTILSLSADIIKQFHVSADDSLHLATAFATECQYFICHDDKLIKAIGKNMSGLPIADISSHADTNPLIKSLDN